MNATVRARGVLERLRADGLGTTTSAIALRERTLLIARSTGRRVRASLEGRPASLPVEPDADAVATEGSTARASADASLLRRYGAHPQGLVTRSLRSFRARARRVDGGLASFGGRLVGRERMLPLTVAVLVLLASFVSVAPAAGQPGSEGTDPSADGPRLVVGGGVLGPADGEDPAAGDPGSGLGAEEVAAGDADAVAAGDAEALDPSALDASALDPSAGEAAVPTRAAEVGQDEPMPDGPYLADGTLLKPVAVDPTVPDARERLRTYRVKNGDTLTGIANKFDVSMMTIWWANKLSAKDELHVGQQLVIPPVDGLVVTVQAGDTLEAIAARTGQSASEIVDFNELADPTLVVGQVLIVPGARGAGIATPKPQPAARPAARPTTRVRSTTPRVTVRAPSSYRGGRFAWPVPGHRVTQYYHYGHLGVDIEGDRGDRVYAAAGGTVIYAGWRNNGGGYVVWISHGSGLYTTYNHLSAVLVGTGRSVARGQLVGRIGATGWATGPHLHFEVWRGGVPGGPDHRVNPMAYY